MEDIPTEVYSTGVKGQLKETVPWFFMEYNKKWLEFLSQKDSEKGALFLVRCQWRLLTNIILHVSRLCLF